MNTPKLIVIPVFKNLNVTRRCVDSVLQHTNLDTVSIVLVNDASPEPELVEQCRQWEESNDSVHLIENSSNLGFVKSANKGMQFNNEHDVVLLNSDTEVSDNWLSKLSAAAYASDLVATVTPFSNNATICSYPCFLSSFDLPVDGLSVINSACEALFCSVSIEIPTAVGFCMYIKRACLDDIGYFDEIHFGKGYGEESDFCMRAANSGWKHVLAADTFVFHEGNVSFGSSASILKEAAEKVIAELHPSYRETVISFVDRDPLFDLRSRLDLSLMNKGEEWAVWLYKAKMKLLQEQKSIIAEKTQAIAQLQNALSDARNSFNIADNALLFAQSVVADKDGVIEKLCQEQHILTEKLASMHKYYQELESIKGSRFWRYTAFIRKLLGTL